MKKLVVFLMMVLVVVTSCGPKPAYKTMEGRKKQKHYNRMQYGNQHNTVMRSQGNAQRK